MKDDISLPAHRVPIALARSFRRGAARHLSEAAWETSRSLAYYWLHWKTLTTQALRECRQCCLEAAGLRRRKETAACASTVVEDARGDAVEVVTPNV
jgi:hypothetical protein